MSNAQWETVMGLEVHVELATNSKIFCSCQNESGAEQNQHVCPACCGMPGMLPVTNKHVVDLGMTAGMMLNCTINRTTTFDKKSYYYPDLPCSYQTTQWFAPICVNGTVTIQTSNGPKDIHIKQIHMEEDAGKLVHNDFTHKSLVDFNRTSVPLIEIVSQPDFRSAEEVVAYLERLRALLRLAGVSECRMERGTMRCDVNLSVRQAGSDKLGTRTEMKNLNSISSIQRAIEFEQWRHIDALENGTEELIQETRRWDDAKGESFSMRSKETAGDYRYFPDPNVMPIVIDDAWFNRIKDGLPEFPEVIQEKYVAAGMNAADAEQIVASRTLWLCAEAAIAQCGLAKETGNWIIANGLAILNKRGMTVDEFPVAGTALGKLIKLVADGVVSKANGKMILEAMFDEDLDPQEYAQANNLTNSNDSGEIEGIIAAVLADSAKDVADFKAGNEKAINPIFGKCMKELKGKVDTGVLRQMLLDALK